MKIIILHGDDVNRSYQRLTKFINEAKKRGWDIVNDKIEDTPSLFGTEKLIIIRDYKSIGKKELNLIKKIPGTLVVYSEKNLPMTFIKSLPIDTKIEKFELPQLLWKFLDTFDINIFHKLIEIQPVEYVLAMMTWKLKQKYQKNPSLGVKRMISNLAEIDVKAKTGKADLLLSLDLLLTKKI